MSIKRSKMVWRSRTTVGSARVMLLALADFADDDGMCFPSVSTLAAMCNVKPRQAGYLLRELEASGNIQIIPNAGPRGTNRYQLVVRSQPVTPLHHSAGVEDVDPCTTVQGCSPVHPCTPASSTPALQRQNPCTAVQTNHHEPSIEPLKRERGRARMRDDDAAGDVTAGARAGARAAPPARNASQDPQPAEPLAWARSAKGARLPDSVTALPDEWLDWARNEKPGLNVEATAASFIDYWHAATGKGAVKRDWFGTWRNWVRREKVPSNGLSRFTANPNPTWLKPEEIDDAFTEPEPPAFTPEQEARFAAARGDPYLLNGAEQADYRRWLLLQQHSGGNGPTH